MPKIDANSIYKTRWTQSIFKIEFNIKTVEQTRTISKTQEKCFAYNKKSIHDFLIKDYKFLHIGFV